MPQNQGKSGPIRPGLGGRMFAFFPKAAVQNRRFRLGPNVRFRPKADIPIFRETVHKTRLWVFSASESAGRKSLFDCLTFG